MRILVIFVLLIVGSNVYSQAKTYQAYYQGHKCPTKVNFDNLGLEYRIETKNDKLIISGNNWLCVGIKDKSGWYKLVWYYDNNLQKEDGHGMAYLLEDDVWLASYIMDHNIPYWEVFRQQNK